MPANAFNGLNMNLGNLSRMSPAVSRSISAENPTGEKGQGARAEVANEQHPAWELGKGWKVRPSIPIEPGETATIAEIEGGGAIQSMWFAGTVTRDLILRFYWDDQEQPSVEVPLPDFFAVPWTWRANWFSHGQPAVMVNSMPVMVGPKCGLNCFWSMPFRKGCRITMENLHPKERAASFHQINYTLTEVPEDCAYFHAQFRRVNPTPYHKEYVIVDGVKGRGQFVGTSMGWQLNNDGWWGEGEIKFFIDGDAPQGKLGEPVDPAEHFPTICGTGTEDYFGGSYNWDVDGEYIPYSTPFMGMHQVIKPNGLYQANHRHAMYRWHVMDPIRFEEDLRVQIQPLGWREGGRFYPGQHDISSVAFWYQTLPTAPFVPLPDRNGLEVV